MTHGPRTQAPRRVVLASFGTRGDVQPFCVLGRALADRGLDVRVVTTGDYREMVGRFGLAAADTGAGFEAILREPEFEELFRGYLSAGFGMIPPVRRLARRMQDRLADLMCATADAVAEADLVVHNPFAFFAGAFARELGRPALGVLCQPMLPSRRTSLSLFGGRSLGGLGNRLSYESLRLVSPVARRAYAEVRRRRGLGRRLGLLTNPLALDPTQAPPILAFSPALSPDPGDWPVSPTVTGAWVKAIAPGTGLPEPVAAFLADGPPPVYVGFGSMFWGARRNTDVVLRALELWGGRAIIGIGNGGLQPPPDLPTRWLAIRSAEHGLLFPRVAAVVHHGGAGTTHAALRAGRPNVVLPLLGDQLYWGRRVAAAGAGEAPTPLGRIEPEDLARRIARACDDPALAAGAGRMARAMTREPGVGAAADRIEAILSEGVR